MASASVYKGLLVLAVGVLFHAAYSTTEWRQFARKTADSHFEFIPMDIILQTFAGLLLAMVCVLKLAGDFREIRSSVELSEQMWENVRNRPSFYLFSHRGRALAEDYTPIQSTASAKKHFKHN
jgi:hypothetical protein